MKTKAKAKQPQHFELISNDLEMRDVSTKFADGIQLDEKQQQYLLPHFLMLLVGKPGSGKTTLLKQLITNSQMYKQKFDYILLISPSHSKMGLQLDKKYVVDTFSLDWIFKQFDTVNDKQIDKIFGHKLGGKNLPTCKTNSVGKVPDSRTFVANDKNSRFISCDFLSKYGLVNSEKVVTDYDRNRMNLERMYKEIAKMPYEEQRRTHVNVLLVLDDVVADIKKQENSPQLARLIMNRRHLILNGTISIIMVTQKYTLIPARVRSNANWLVLFQLNPLDFENVYRDAVVDDLRTWREILRFVFGISIDATSAPAADAAPKKNSISNGDKTDEEDDEDCTGGDRKQEGKKKKTTTEMDILEYMKGKKYENIGIWVEYNLYFKNFKRLQFN